MHHSIEMIQFVLHPGEGVFQEAIDTICFRAVLYSTGILQFCFFCEIVDPCVLFVVLLQVFIVCVIDAGL